MNLVALTILDPWNLRNRWSLGFEPRSRHLFSSPVHNRLCDRAVLLQVFILVLFVTNFLWLHMSGGTIFLFGFESGVRGREVERRPRNLEVPISIPGSGYQLWDFFIDLHTSTREYWCSSQEAESREISISCKNLFFNRCKIDMFKLFKLRF